MTEVMVVEEKDENWMKEIIGYIVDWSCPSNKSEGQKL